ncbi:hypothetical protein CLV63_1246 [Murinocardiopsis flavida]|uniref:Uncharacterized protein n=1 Tax=Murinocardiopsis flavida TaxID=645275 RepID=A0A2P8CY60_9ACTN|nr:hypothetical protein [Murinocardiopsis flavida]PSK89902.1 hypothetical protein CLV63_1246 [Murinocardiopsis flavida]
MQAVWQWLLSFIIFLGSGLGNALSNTELWSGLIGAAFGGFLSFWGVNRQTEKMLAHEKKMADDGRAEARQDEIRVREERALGELLHSLFVFEDGFDILKPQWLIAQFRQAGDPEPPEMLRRRETIAALGYGLRVALPLIPDSVVRSRYHALCDVVQQFRNLPLHSDDERADQERAELDIRNYIRYLRHTIRAVLRDELVPEHKERPALLRHDGAPWTPPVRDPENEWYPL